MKVLFSSKHLAKKLNARKVTLFGNLLRFDTIFNGCLELTEERFCQILSDCRGEGDLETNETEENQECYLDSEEEEALTKIWGRKRSVRPRRMEDFF